MTRTSLPSFVSAAFEAVAARALSARRSRQRRIALLSLMDMDAGRLDDLGISVTDVTKALLARRQAGYWQLTLSSA